MLPQSVSVRTNRRPNKVKQGVVRVPKAVRRFIMPDGRILDEKELTPEQKQAFAQKIMDTFLVPLAYDAVMRDMERERQQAE